MGACRRALHLELVETDRAVEDSWPSRVLRAGCCQAVNATRYRPEIGSRPMRLWYVVV
jgi:hypothetical protein